MALRSALSTWEDKGCFWDGKDASLGERKSTVFFWTWSLEMSVGNPNGDISLEFKKRLCWRYKFGNHQPIDIFKPRELEQITQGDSIDRKGEKNAKSWAFENAKFRAKEEKGVSEINLEE